MSSLSTDAAGLRGGGWCGFTNVGDRGGESSSSAPIQRRKRTRSRAIWGENTTVRPYCTAGLKIYSNNNDKKKCSYILFLVMGLERLLSSGGY